MFMLVHLSDNNKIVINMGQDVTQANDLVKMFEHNDQNAPIVIKSDGASPTLGFVLATNEAFIDVASLKSTQKAALEKKQQEIKQLEARLEVANHRISVLEGQLVPTNN